MKKAISFLFLISIVLTSCKEEHNDRKGYSFKFLPRKASFLDIAFGEQKISYFQGIKHTDFWSLEKDRDIVSRNKFFISVFTTNFDPAISDDPNFSIDTLLYYNYEYLDEHIPSIEKQIELDYSRPKSAELRSADMTFDDIIYIDYRITEIKNLKITALDTPLFGKAAGESLNAFFDIAQYNPPVIVSAPTNTLVFGYSNSTYPTSIEEWLDLSPLAQANIYLIPNTEIPEIPVQVQFVVQMETAEGVILSDTTRMITIDK
jgi:hypothetical protein